MNYPEYASAKMVSAGGPESVFVFVHAISLTGKLIGAGSGRV